MASRCSPAVFGRGQGADAGPDAAEGRRRFHEARQKGACFNKGMERIGFHPDFYPPLAISQRRWGERKCQLPGLSPDDYICIRTMGTKD